MRCEGSSPAKGFRSRDHRAWRRQNQCPAFRPGDGPACVHPPEGVTRLGASDPLPRRRNRADRPPGSSHGRRRTPRPASATSYSGKNVNRGPSLPPVPDPASQRHPLGALGVPLPPLACAAPVRAETEDGRWWPCPLPVPTVTPVDERRASEGVNGGIPVWDSKPARRSARNERPSRGNTADASLARALSAGPTVACCSDQQAHVRLSLVHEILRALRRRGRSHHGVRRSHEHDEPHDRLLSVRRFGAAVNHRI